MIGEVLEAACDCLAACQVFRLKIRAVGSKDELRLGFGGSGAVLERFECLRDLSCLAGQDVDVVGLENAAEVGLVRRPGAKALDRRLLITEGFKEGIGEGSGVKGLLRKVCDGLLDLNGVQIFVLYSVDAKGASHLNGALPSTHIHIGRKSMSSYLPAPILTAASDCEDGSVKGYP